MQRFFIIAAIACLFPIEASANPAWVTSLSAQPVDGPHVRLVYRCDTVYEDDNPPILNYHGTSHTPWRLGQDTGMDTGSGMRSVHVMGLCDCHVPTEQKLIYQSEPGTPSYGVYTTVTVAATYAQDPLAGNPCGEECALAGVIDGGGVGEADAALPVATGGSPGTGGALSTGGDPGTGGPLPAGGTVGGDSDRGGSPGTGVAPGTGGDSGTGGAPGTGGALTTGGTSDSGGASSTGGVWDSGGAPGTGGALVTGGPTGSTGSIRTDAHGKGGGSCAFAPTAQRTTLPVLAGVAGLVTIWRRRRS